jgi:hypothetical protein
MNPDYALNPETGRMIKKATAKYRRFVKQGLIVEPPPVPPVAVPPVAVPPVAVPPVAVPPVAVPPVAVRVPNAAPVAPDPPVRAMLAEELTNLVVENTETLSRDLTVKETEKLLRQLLFEKLCSEKKKAGKKAKAPKKKKTYKIRTPPSSSSSESSESD